MFLVIPRKNPERCLYEGKPKISFPHHDPEIVEIVTCTYWLSVIRSDFGRKEGQAHSIDSLNRRLLERITNASLGFKGKAVLLC